MKHLCSLAHLKNCNQISLLHFGSDRGDIVIMQVDVYWKRKLMVCVATFVECEMLSGRVARGVYKYTKIQSLWKMLQHQVEEMSGTEWRLVFARDNSLWTLTLRLTGRCTLGGVNALIISGRHSSAVMHAVRVKKNNKQTLKKQPNTWHISSTHLFVIVSPQSSWSRYLSAGELYSYIHVKWLWS